jgi:hypothetical protein
VVNARNITRLGDGIHIEGYPNAVGVRRIKDRHAQQLQALVLHRSDLNYCREALTALAGLDRSAQPLLAEALWLSAIARYFKCFGNSGARTQLSRKRVLKDHPGADEVFAYFRKLRDKHLIHDENPYSQSFCGVVLNARAAESKVADIIAMTMNPGPVDDDNIGSFSQLVGLALAWVEAKHDELHTHIRQMYEAWTYEDLLALPMISYTVPTSDEVGVAR